jgi:hypothetical protein
MVFAYVTALVHVGRSCRDVDVIEQRRRRDAPSTRLTIPSFPFDDQSRARAATATRMFGPLKPILAGVLICLGRTEEARPLVAELEALEHPPASQS